MTQRNNIVGIVGLKNTRPQRARAFKAGDDITATHAYYKQNIIVCWCIDALLLYSIAIIVIFTFIVLGVNMH